MKTRLIITLLLIFLLPLVIPLTTPSFYHNQDGFSHLLKVAKLVEALKEGQFPVRWSGNLVSGLGSPIFSFNFPLPFYLTAIPHFSGISAVSSLKLLLGLSVIASGLIIFFWLLGHFNLKSALVGAIFWSWAPYRLLNLYHRAAVGEVVATLFIPWIFWSVDRINKSSKFIGILALPTSGLILSHNVIALIGMGLLLIYTLLTISNLQVLKRIALETGLALSLTAWFWLPALLETDTVNLSGLLKNSYLYNFPPFKAFLYSRWEGGSVIDGKTLGMSFQLGLAHWLVLLISLVTLIKNPLSKYSLWGFTLVLGSLLLAQPTSVPLYKIIPLLPNVLYPWRFLGFAILGTSILVATITKTAKPWLTASLIVLAILANRNYLTISPLEIDETKIKGLVSQTADMDGEFLPKWANREIVQKSKVPLKPSFILTQPKGNVTTWKDQGHLIVGLVKLSLPSEVVINRFYWPGWVAYINGERQVLMPNEQLGGRMQIYLPPGNHTLKITLENTPIQASANTLSLATLLLLTISLIVRKLSFLMKS